MNSPKISIVTACYNSTEFLHRLHASLGRQTFRDFEWVTVDDMSSDATLELLKALNSPGLGGMRAYALPQNTGGGVAIGLGVERAAGEILLIVDHDDELEDFALQVVVDEWKEVVNRSDICGMFFRQSNPSKRTIVGECLAQGTEFTISWQSNFKPSITDGVIAFRTSVAQEFFNAMALESICLSGVPLSLMTKRYKLRAGSSRPIHLYHRDNLQSQTNSVKVSRKTVYTYAKYVDAWDRYYFARPLHWTRHVIAMCKISMAVYGRPCYQNRYINSRWIRAASFLLAPLGILRYVFSPKLTVLHFPEFNFNVLVELQDARRDSRYEVSADPENISTNQE